MLVEPCRHLKSLFMIKPEFPQIREASEFSPSSSISISLNSRHLSPSHDYFLLQQAVKIFNSSIKKLSQSFLEWKDMELRRNLKRKALADCTNTIHTSIPRKPFSDHTNIPTTTTFVPPSKKPFSSSSSLTKPPKPSLSIRNSDENSFTSCGSNNEENPRFRIPQPSSTPPVPTITTAGSGNCESDDAENPRIRIPQPSSTLPIPTITTSDSGNCESDDAENPRIRPQPSTPPRPTTIAAANFDDGIGTVYTRRKTVEKTRDKGKAVMVSSSCPPAGRTRRNEDQLDKENRDVNLPKSYSYTVACPKAKKKRRTSLPLPQDFIDKQKAYFAEIDAFELPEEVVSESELE